MVAIASPAPFTTQPMSPSSFTYESPRSRALRAPGVSSSGSRQVSHSRWRKSALSSTITLLSSASTLPSAVTTSGLISASEQSPSR